MLEVAIESRLMHAETLLTCCTACRAVEILAGRGLPHGSRHRVKSHLVEIPAGKKKKKKPRAGTERVQDEEFGWTTSLGLHESALNECP